MKPIFSTALLGAALTACGPLTEKEEGGDLDFIAKLQNDADVPIQVKVVFDLCKIEDADASKIAVAHQFFSEPFIGKCETDQDYDDNQEKIELASSTGKHNFTVSSECRDATTCDNDGCVTALDANCKEQPVARIDVPSVVR